MRKLPELIHCAERTLRVSLYNVTARGKPAKKSSYLLLSHLAVQANRGVECHVLLNMVARGAFLKAQNLEAVAWMRQRGIQTRQLVGSRCNHAKYVVVDAKFAILGSHNWTPCSLRRNHEVSVATDDPTAVGRLVEQFDHLWSNSVALSAAASSSASEPSETDE